MIGLDASNVNTEALFRAQLPKVDFAILKATEGLTFVDKTSPARATSVRAAGKLLGWYHFDRSNDDGAAQAAFFLGVAKPRPGETCWLDMETADGQPWATVSARAATFLRTVYAATGALCGLYSNRSELVAVLAAATPNDRNVIEAAPLWFADPDHAAGRPSCPTPWAIHQYGSVGGLDANVTHPAFRWASMAVPGTHPPAPAPTPPSTGDDMPTADEVATAIFQRQADADAAVRAGKPLTPAQTLAVQAADLVAHRTIAVLNSQAAAAGKVAAAPTTAPKGTTP